MLVLGLTGSIATGKSTVSSLLRSPPYNLPIIDADVIARKVVEPGTRGYRLIVSHFGPTTPDLLLPASDPLCGGREDGPNGKGRPLNRPALGRRVFGDSEEARANRKVLNGIVHPAVRLQMVKEALWYYILGHWCVVLDVPLLYESALDRFCGATMVVAVSDPAVQMKRLMERDTHLSEQEARDRVGAQWDVREKAERAKRTGGVVVWNDAGREELQTKVDDCVKELRRKTPRWWSALLWVCPPMAAIVGAWCLFRVWSRRKSYEKELEREKSKL